MTITSVEQAKIESEENIVKLKLKHEASEAAKAREWTTAENAKERSAQSIENAKARDWTTANNIKEREWQINR